VIFSHEQQPITMTIDRQRLAAVALLQGLGYKWTGTAWVPAAQSTGSMQAVLEAADALHGIVADRAAVLAGCIEESPEQEELAALGDALERYEAARRELGRTNRK